MSEPVVYMRGFPSFTERPTSRPELIDDLKAIATLPDELIGALRERLTKADGFLAPAALRALVLDAVQAERGADAVQRVLRNLDSSSLKKLLAALNEEREEKDFPFDQATFDRLKQNLTKLIQTYPALARFKKAERLAKIVGHPLEAIEFICDLRPIFDDDRKHVEGLMPYTRLCVIATGDDGLPKSFEVQMTNQQVIDLAEKAEKAMHKLETLRASIETWLPNSLPDLSLTRIRAKESNDE